MWGPQGRAGVAENCCISVVPALWTVPLEIFIPCSPTLVLPAEIVCPGIPSLSSYTQTSCTMDLGVTCTSLRISVLLHIVTSLSPFSHPGWAAERADEEHAEFLAPIWLSQPGHTPAGLQFPPVENGSCSSPTLGLQPEQKQAPQGQGPTSCLGSVVSAGSRCPGSICWRMAQPWDMLESVGPGHWQCLGSL